MRAQVLIAVTPPKQQNTGSVAKVYAEPTCSAMERLHVGKSEAGGHPGHAFLVARFWTLRFHPLPDMSSLQLSFVDNLAKFG
jgi:hypothetical protein